MPGRGLPHSEQILRLRFGRRDERAARPLTTSSCEERQARFSCGESTTCGEHTSQQWSRPAPREICSARRAIKSWRRVAISTAVTIASICCSSSYSCSYKGCSHHQKDAHHKAFVYPFFVLCSYLGSSHHQADACHLASVYLGFRSIWNTHFCLRLQPHLYPSLVETSLGRDVRPNSDISQRMSSPTPPSETRNYC